MKIAIAQMNATVGNIPANLDTVLRFVQQGLEQHADLMIFPELCVSGYPPEDLVLKKHFVKACEEGCTKLAAVLPNEMMLIIGCPTWGTDKARNSVLVFHQGRRLAQYDKMLLPNYGVFDEQRVFEAGNQPGEVMFRGVKFGLNICEDTWFEDSPAIAPWNNAPPDMLINLSASPYHRNKISLRETVLGNVAQTLHTPVLYANIIGGQDELVFDGGSMLIDAQGKVTARAKQFDEDLFCIETNLQGTPLLGTSTPKSIHDANKEIYAALTLGTRDYVNKNGFEKAIVAISGGIDSALVAAIAVDALGPERVVGLTMPSQYSSTETLNDASTLGQYLGIDFHTLPIKNLFDAYLDDLADTWEGLEAGLAEENLQARIRGTFLMAMSNKFGWLALTTGNKSELATGYCTLYGDMAGGFAVIKDVPKCLVFKLSRWKNKETGREVIPASIIERPPSAELKPDQKDTDSLPPYEILDGILERYVEEDLSASEIITHGFDAQTVLRVIRMVDLNEYKRRQAPPGIRITPKAFGKDRRMPITNQYREKKLADAC